MHTHPIATRRFIHVSRHAIAGEDLFKEKKDYYFFLRQYFIQCNDVPDTYAYGLLNDQVHFIGYVKEKNNASTGLATADRLQQLVEMYTLVFNRKYRRAGSLFMRKTEVDHLPDNGLLPAICQCHLLPQTYRLVEDFRQWEFTSWYAILQRHNIFVAADKVVKLFGGLGEFNEMHKKKPVVKREIERSPGLIICGSAAGKFLSGYESHC